MKSVLISIKPKWCELIASGEKTIEVRKNSPKIETPFKCYIYCTKPSKAHQTICGCMVLNNDELYRHPTQGIKYGDSIELICCDDYTEDNFLNGKVIGEFVCDEIEHFTKAFFDEQDERDTEEIAYFLEESCLSYSELCNYVKLDDFYGWHISDLKIYDKPRELSEFASFCMVDEKRCASCEHYLFDSDDVNGYRRWCGVYRRKPLTHPPQSWCYVEELPWEK